MSSFPSSRRIVAAASLVALMAGCSGNNIAPTSSVAGTSNAIAGQGRSLSQYRALANGQGVRVEQSPALVRGWMSPDAATDKNVIFWGDFDSNTITLYSAKGANGKELGQITTGLNEPERLFVDANGNVYASNLGNSTVTAYKPGATSPFLTISTGISNPTGITVDAAGTVYVANVGNDTITEYPKGKTSPSITIANAGAEYLATDAKDNLYATEGTIVEYAKGSTTGTSLALTIGSAGALQVDSKGTLIVLDESNSDVDYFPAGKTSPSAQVSLGGFPFGIALSKNNKQIYVSNLVGSPFEIQSIAYPKGKKAKIKLNTNSGDWPVSISPNNVLGK